MRGFLVHSLQKLSRIMRLFFRWYNSRFAIFIHRHISQRCLGDLHAFRLGGVALYIDFHIHSDGGVADFYDVGIKAHDVADEQRLLEHEGIHGHRCHSAFGTTDRRYAARNINLPHQPATKNITCVIGIRGHRGNADGGFAVG